MSATAAHDPSTPPRPDAPDLPEPGPDRARRRRILRAVAVLGAALLVTAGWTAHRHAEARAEERLTAAQGVLATATAGLRLARQDGQAVLAASAGHVDDEAVRRDLAALLTGGSGTEPTDGPDRAGRTRLATTLAHDRTRRAADLAVATEAVRVAQTAWEHATATAAHAEAVAALTAAVEESATLLAASGGHVLDDTPRWALTAAIDAAVAVRDAAAPDGAVALTDAATSAREHVGSLAAARAAVAEAQAAWQAEQERVAAAAAQRAASTGTGDRVRSGSGAAGSRTTGSGPTGGGGTRGSTSGGGSVASGGSGGTGWVQGWKPGDPVPDGYQVIEETEGGGWCGDEFGASWEC